MARWLRRGGDPGDDYPPITPRMPVDGWNTTCPDFAFALSGGWRAMTPAEALAQGTSQNPLLAGAVPQEASALSSVIGAWCIGKGDIGEALRFPDRMVAVRSKGNAHLVAGPERLRVAGGRALQIQLDEAVPGEEYGLEGPILQRRVETMFDGVRKTWILQLVTPLDAYSVDLGVYVTALATWQWDHP